MLLGGLSFSIFFVLLVAAMTGFVIWRWKHPYQPAPYPAKRENGISFATTYYQPGGQGPPVGESVCNNGHHNDATAKFCRACGVALPRGSNGNKPPQLTCPGGHRSEGTRAPDGSVHCWCGAALPEPLTIGHSDTGATSPPEPLTNHTNTIATGQVPAVRCSLGHPNTPGNELCATCGIYMTRQYVAPLDNPDERDRPKVMFLWLWWFVFSPVVLFLAPTYSDKAKRLGFRETGRYWVPFWLTLAGYAAAGILFAMFINATHSTSSYSSTSGSGYTYAAPSSTAQPRSSNYSYPYAVTQSDLYLDREMVVTIMDIDNNRNWKTSSGQIITKTPVEAVCEDHFEGDISEHYNCNIAFSDGSSNSYWVDSSGSSYSARIRTH